jgi:hypothetical protein
VNGGISYAQWLAEIQRHIEHEAACEIGTGSMRCNCRHAVDVAIATSLAALIEEAVAVAALADRDIGSGFLGRSAALIEQLAAGFPTDTEQQQPHPRTCKCHGAGWVRGVELEHADADTIADTLTRYSCDGAVPDTHQPGALG